MSELESTPIPPASTMTPATAANSTTLAQHERATRRNKLVLGILATLATVALAATAFAPWNLLAAAALYLASVVVAYLTNSLTPEKLDALVAQLTDAGERAAVELSKRGKGAP